MFVKKKSHKLRNTVIVLALLALAFMGFVAYADFFAGMRKDDTAVSVYFPVDAKEEEIIQILKENEIIKYPAAFKICTFFGSNEYVNGSHVLKKSMTYPQILNTIKNKNNGSIIAIVVNPGDTIDDIALIVSDELEIAKEYFYNALAQGTYAVDTTRTTKKYEGYLMPGTYNFTKDTDAAGVVSAMLSKVDEFVGGERVERIKQLNLTVDEALTLASIVQAEAKSDDDMPNIAAKLIQKLRDGALLESEATLKYSLGKDELNATDKITDTPYNTFLYKGLPKGPICSPGENALKAVLQ